MLKIYRNKINTFIVRLLIDFIILVDKHILLCYYYPKPKGLKMAKKSRQDKILDANFKEDYSLNVQTLMEAIPEVTVLKHVDPFEYEGKILYTSTKWTVGNYVVYSDMREVRTIEANDEEAFWFHMKVKDYKNFVKACNQRRKELFGRGTK